MVIKNIIFDLHGVLINSQKLRNQYGRYISDYLFKDYGIPYDLGLARHHLSFDYWIKEAQSWGNLKGNKLKNHYNAALYRWVMMLLEDKAKFHPNLIDYGKKLEFQVAKQINALYPEVLPTLQMLCNQIPKIRLVIASSAHTRHIRGILIKNQLDKLIDQFFGIDSFWIPKYNQSYYQQLAESLRIRKRDSIFVGNSGEEILLSEKKGFIPILVHREKKVNSRAINTANIVIKDLKSFIEVIRTI